MPKFLVELNDGRKFQVEANRQPTPEEAMQLLGGGEQPALSDKPYLSQLGEALSTGYGQMTSGVGATFNALTGDTPDVAANLAEMGRLQREQQASRTAEDIALTQDFARSKAAYEQAQGPLETIEALGGYLGATARNPGAAFKQAVQSAPNALISGVTGLAGYGLGGLLGAGAGIETGPGAILTGIAGAAAGGAVSNTLMEAGPAIYDILNERTGGAAANMTADEITAYLNENPDVMSEGLKTGAIRGSVIGLAEGLGLKGAGALSTIPERAAARAVQKTLVDAGVDVASKEAVEAAVKNPAIFAAIKQAGETAKQQFSSAGNLARMGGAAGIEIGASGAGEAGAQMATGREVDPTEVYQEMLGEVGLSLPMALGSKIIDSRKYLSPTEGVTGMPPPLESQIAAEALNATTDTPFTDISGQAAADTIAQNTELAMRMPVQPVEAAEETAVEDNADPEFLQKRWQSLEDRALAVIEAGAMDRLPVIRDEQARLSNRIARITAMKTPSLETEMLEKPSQTITGSNGEIAPEMPVPVESTVTSPGEAPPSLPEAGPPVVDNEAPTGTPVQAAPIQPTTTQEDAVQEQIPDEGVLRQEGPEMELQGVVEQNVQPEEVAGEVVQEEVVAPQAGVATERDLTNLEQMTPDEVNSIWNDAKDWANTPDSEIVAKYQKQFNASDAYIQAHPFAPEYWRETQRKIISGASPLKQHTKVLNSAIAGKKPVSAAAVDAYGITLPEGYVQDGELYVYRPSGTVEAKSAPPAKPAPQAEQPAPQRDTSKPEQMTPGEYASSERDPELPKNYVLSDGNGNFVTEEKNGWFKVWRLTGTHATLAGTVGFKGAEGLAKAKARLKEVSAEMHEEKLQNGIRTKKPVSKAAVDAYGITLPEGYVKQGDLYVFQPQTTKAAAETDIETGAPKLDSKNDYFASNLASRAWRIAAGMQWDDNAGDWVHPNYPGRSRSVVESEITESNPPSKADVQRVFNELAKSYGREDLIKGEKTKEQDSQDFIQVGRFVKVGYRVPIYEKGEVVGGKTNKVVGKITRIMPDGKVEVRLNQGGFKVLPPSEIEDAPTHVGNKPLSTQTTAAETQTSGVATERDLTRPEQMTPQEFDQTFMWSSDTKGNRSNGNLKSGSWFAKSAKDTLSFARRNSDDPVYAVKRDKIRPIQAEQDDVFGQEFIKSGSFIRGGDDVRADFSVPQLFADKPHAYLVRESVKKNQPVSAAAVDTYQITLPEGYVRQGDLYIFQPQTKQAAETQTPESVGRGLGGSRSVQSEPSRGSILEVEKESAKTAIESTGKSAPSGYGDVVNSARKSLKDRPADFKAQEQVLSDLMKLPVADLQSAFEVVTGSPTKLANKRQLANNVLNELLAEAQESKPTAAEDTFRKAEREAEEEIQRQNAQSISNLFDKLRTNPQAGQVTQADVNQAIGALQNSGEVPNAIFTWTGTTEDLLRQRATMERQFPGAVAAASMPNVEGVFENGMAFVFSNRVVVTDLDRRKAAEEGISPSVAAVKRVVTHENMHKGLWLLSPKQQSDIMSFLRQMFPAAELDELAKSYRQYSDWRTNPVHEMALLDERLQKYIEETKTIPTDGVWKQFWDYIKEIWRKLTGKPNGEPTLQSMKDVVRLIRSALKNAHKARPDRTIDGGRVLMSVSGGRSFVPAVNIDGRVEIGASHYDAWIKHALRQIPNFKKDGLSDEERRQLADRWIVDHPEFMAYSLRKEGFVSGGEFLNRQDSLKKFKSLGGVQQMAPGEPDRDWLDASDVEGYRFSYASEQDEASSIGQQTARYAASSPRTIEAIVGVRQAYASMPKSNGAAVMLDDLFAETAKLVPNLTRPEFDRVIQGMYDDNAALLNDAQNPSSVTILPGAMMSMAGGANDAEYMAAVEAGDMEKAQKMVDEAAKEAGYNVGPVWHGTKGKKKGVFPFEVFKTKEAGEQTKAAGTPVGSYFAEERTYADGAAMLASNFGRSGKPVVGRFYLRSDVQKTPGVETAVEYVATDPSQIKSADPVTRDDKGNIIPPSKRFQPTSPDIRFSIASTPEQQSAAAKFKSAITAAAKGLPDLREYEGRLVKAASGEALDVEPHNVLWFDGFMKASEQLLSDLQKQGLSLQQIYDKVAMDTEFKRELGLFDEETGSGQAATILSSLLTTKTFESARKAKTKEEKLRSDTLHRKAAAYYYGIGTVRGQNLVTLRLLQNDPRTRYMFMEDKVTNEMLKKAEHGVNVQFGDGYAATQEAVKNAVNASAEAAKTEVADAVENATEEDQDAIDLAEGEATLTDKQKSAWERFKDAIRTKGLIAKALQAIRSGNKAKASISAADRNAIFQMTEEELLALDAKMDKIMLDAEDVFFAESDAATRKKREKMVKTAQKRAKKGQDIDIKPTDVSKIINQVRRDIKTASGKPIQWREIFRQPGKTVEEYRQNIFNAVNSNEAFKDLDEAQKRRLSELFAEAWQAQRDKILASMIEQHTYSLERQQKKEAAKALRDARNQIIEAVNLGAFSNDELTRVLGEKFGFKTSFTEDEKQKLSDLAEKLQDEKLNKAKRNKLAREFLSTLQSGTQIPIAELLSNWWVSAVLSGGNTVSAIASSFLNGTGIGIMGTHLARALRELMKGNTANAIDAITSLFKAYAEHISSFPSAANRAWQYLWSGDVSFLESAANDPFGRVNTLADIAKYQVVADQVAKDPNKVKAVMGRFMQFMGRLLTALDAFNVIVTKAGTVSLAIRQSGLTPEQIRDAELKNDLKFYKDKIVREDPHFGGKHPTSAKEKAYLSSLAEAEMYADLAEMGVKMENADYLASESAMTMNPTGSGGIVYNAIKALDTKVTSETEKHLDMAQVAWAKSKNAEDAIKLFTWSLVHFFAKQGLNVFGLRFVRFAGNKFNQSLSFVPGLGLLRMIEADNKELSGRQEAFKDTIIRNQTLGWIIMFAGWAIIKAIEEEPDDEKRGWFINGGWNNLTPDQKKQKISRGEKQYTIGTGDYVFSYQNWPISQPLAALGALSDLVRFSQDKWKEKTTGGKAGSAVISGMQAALEIPALTQVNEIFANTMASKDPAEQTASRLSRVTAGWMGGFMPRILKDLDYIQDPTMRRYETLFQKAASHVPVYRRYVGSDYYDILGNKIEKNAIPGSRDFMKLEDKPEYRMLGALNARGIWLTPANAEYRMVGKGRFRRRLTQEEADRYSLETGKLYRQMVMNYGPRALQMPVERAKDYISAKADDMRDLALQRAVRN